MLRNYYHLTTKTMPTEGYQPENELDTSNPPQQTKPVDWEDKYTRLYADFENYKKRATKDKFTAQFVTKVNTLDPILDLHNELRIAMDMTKDKTSLDALSLFMSKFSNFLRENDVSEISNDDYDSNVHQVITVIDDYKYTEPTITAVISNGYTMGGKIIRYPKVILSRKES
jgi:molecular chaperone GrpE